MLHVQEGIELELHLTVSSWGGADAMSITQGAKAAGAGGRREVPGVIEAGGDR